MKCFWSLLLLLFILAHSVQGQQTAEEWTNKGLDYAIEGKYVQAIQCYDEAIRINPDYALAWYTKGEALRATGDSVNADAAFARARELGRMASAAFQET